MWQLLIHDFKLVSFTGLANRYFEGDDSSSLHYTAWREFPVPNLRHTE